MFYKSIISLFFLALSFCVFHSQASAADPSEDLGKPTFEVKVNTFTPGGEKIIGGGSSGSAVEDANFALGYIIEQLMLFIGGFSLLVMTIGAGYIIIHRGDDSTLSKGKDIIVAGALGLTVALFSYLMVSVLRYLLYT